MFKLLFTLALLIISALAAPTVVYTYVPAPLPAHPAPVVPAPAPYEYVSGYKVLHSVEPVEQHGYKIVY
ncbi:hypothetical protein M8J77_015307 [Diaphorina citri]|nr:hypothetical protein M8J77_015307 [Diaphorina citri]